MAIVFQSRALFLFVFLVNKLNINSKKKKKRELIFKTKKNILSLISKGT